MFEGSVLLGQDLEALCPDSSVLSLEAIVGASDVSVPRGQRSFVYLAGTSLSLFQEF